MSDINFLTQFRFACPQCRDPLKLPEGNTFWCPQDGLKFSCVEGIWRFLRPDRQDHFRRFIQDYETVRREEGRGSHEADYYRSLPYLDPAWTLSDQWTIRAKSFESLLHKVVEPMERTRDRGFKILDLGAGNAWLSNRMALRHHTVAAVDIATNSFDGLGAHRFYTSQFLPVQAEFLYLPFYEGQFDLVIFNASFHYSEQYESVLAESLRVLSPEGKLVILDSPIYRDTTSGLQMVQEREAHYEKKYGFPSNAIQSENFLTYRRLSQLADDLRLHWNVHEPFYGLKWKIRPLKALVVGEREPAKFALIVGDRIT